jgi:hypothetical protein
MKFLERKDSKFLEIMRALLQLMRLLNEEEISDLLAIKLRNFLNDFLVKANFLSYLKRKHTEPILENPDCEKIIEILCGKNWSEVAFIGQRYSFYRRIEKFRDLHECRKILFENLNTRKTADFLFGPSIIVVIKDDLIHVIEKDAEIPEVFTPMGFGEVDHFFRLYHEDRQLIIHYAHNCIVDMQVGCCVDGITLANFH